MKHQEQSFADVIQNKCYFKLSKFHWKVPALESLSDKVTGFQACNFIKKSCFMRRTRSITMAAPYLFFNYNCILLCEICVSIDRDTLI